MFSLFPMRARKMANTHEWNAGGSERKSLMTGIDFQAAFPWFAKAIREKEILQIRGLDGLPAEAVAEMAEFKRQGIRSSINIPMISGGAFMGFVGFDSVREKSQWNEESISLLKIVGEIFANALNRSCAEKALRESERKFRELADLLPQVVFEFDKKGNFTFVNRFAKEFFGPTEEQGIMNSLQHITAGDKPKAIDHFRKILKGEKISAPEFGYTNIDGTVSSLAVHASRIVRDGKIVGCRGVAIDVTERKRWEDLYRSLVEKSFAGIYVLQGGKFKYLNSVFPGLQAIPRMRSSGTRPRRSSTPKTGTMRGTAPRRCSKAREPPLTSSGSSERMEASGGPSKW